jgi:hypothetical protein
VRVKNAVLNFLSCRVRVCYNNRVRRILCTIFTFWLCGLFLSARAETYSLADGTALTGDIVSFDDIGVKIRMGDGSYSDRVAWTKFSQEGLKELASNPKIKPLVEPFIEIPPSQHLQRPEVNVQNVTRLEVPQNQSLFGALFSSSVGLFAWVLIYASNIFAGFEIAVVRGRPKALVMGIAAALPIIGPIIFLLMPVRMVDVPGEIPVAEGDPATFAVPGQPPTPGEMQVTAGAFHPPAANPAAGQIFQRGQFTFNRRFFETKFSGYFGVVRHGADKDQVLLVKTGRGQYQVERITRIAASDVHLEVVLGEVRQEVMMPFTDIQEIQLKPKDA